MIKKFNVADTNYYLDSNSLTLYKDKVIKNETEIKTEKKLENNKILYKLVFNVANTCNLNCMYCYASCGNYGRDNTLMSVNIAHKIVQSLKQNYDTIRTVYFFGGEPTINFKTIKYLVDELKSKFVINDYRIVTNATLINDEMIKFFCENNFKIYVSIDGPEMINNHLRGNYFKKLISTIQQLKKSKIKDKLELICTYTKFHQDNMSMTELEKFFDNLGVKYSISDVITNDKSLKIRKTKKDIINQEISFIDKSIDRIKNNSLNVGISAYLRNVLDALILKSKSDYFCNELQNDYSRVYDYNGEIYPCIRLIGTHKTGDDLICKFNKKSSDNCRKCWAREFCHDCTADIILGNVKPSYVNKNCHKKILYKYTIEKLLEIFHNDSALFNELVNKFYNNYLF